MFNPLEKLAVLRRLCYLTLVEKVCAKCGGSKPATHEFFGKDKRASDGLRSRSKLCKYASERKYMKGYLARYYQKNKGKLSGQNQAWADEHSDLMAKYRADYQKRNCSTLKQRAKAWRQANPERVRAILKRYEGRNPEIRRLIKSNRRAREIGLSETAKATHIRALIKGQKGMCWWCQKPLGDYHLDHRIPLSRGGTSDAGNLVLACKRCNLKKSNKMPWEMDSPKLL